MSNEAMRDERCTCGHVFQVPMNAEGRTDWPRVPSGWVVDSDAPGVPHPPDHYPGRCSVGYEVLEEGA